jgi:hypothetical protein
VILVVPTILLLLAVASQLGSYKQSGIGGWNLAFNILTARASPFGTPAGVWAVILAVWGFLLVPAIAGAVAAFILGAYLTRTESSIDHAVEMLNSDSAKRFQEAQGRIEAAKKKKQEADQQETAANTAEAQAAAQDRTSPEHA